ncbi:MAG: uroporphyrinogen-III C-methyltransferase [Gammaproteobacteria bacterium]|nr:uroporphyrinogen-III C-methyltransferase [Gammaproteobacteria bacterium]
MSQLPLVVDMHGLPVACLGHGPRIEAKASLLLEKGAVLTWYGDPPTRLQGRIRVRERTSWQVDAALLVLVELDDRGEAEGIARVCRQHARLVWVAGQTDAGSLGFPAIIERGALRIAIDTSGRFPTLARLVREQIEVLFPASLAERIEQLATQLKQSPRRPRDALRAAWSQLLAPFSRSIPVAAPRVTPVALVGAGPGDPELLTLRALRLIGEADVVLYDRLVSPAILNLVRRDAQMIHVGKARADHSVPQPDIHALLIEHARQGRRVVRLKGGDPFIFGRGGEEMEALAEAGIDCEVVPGITAASGCATYAGIPLTHRDYAQSVRFVTGHLKDHSFDLPWPALVEPGQTLVFYMGLVGLPYITQALQAHGMSATTPVAIISRGTLPDQQVLTGTLADIAEQAVVSAIKAPTLIVVGDVVRVRTQREALRQQRT